MSEPKVGSRYTKDGVSIDVHDVKDGEVWVRRWPKGVESQSFFANCIRVPLDVFNREIEGATLES